MSGLSRRDFIRYALVGGAAMVGGAAIGTRLPGRTATRYGTRLRLGITEALVEMIDHTMVFHWAFEDLTQLKPMPQMPGPLIQTTEGDEVRLSVTNYLSTRHGFRIPGVPGPVGEGIEIPPGNTVDLDFVAPEGGSYMYFDHLNAPVNRVLGLHGPMVVMPAAGNTPYSSPTPNVQRLFDDLGKAEHFPGEPWVPERSRIWLLHSIDPGFNAMAAMGEQIDAAMFVEHFTPRYFTINGLSGAYASHDHSTIPSGRIGQPHVIRIINAGLNVDSPHIHGNHVYLISRRNSEGVLNIERNAVLVDTFSDEAGQCMDWLLPFIRPPDIPGDERTPLRELLREELSLTLGGVSQSPLTFPMHGHNELSQSAAGGNYPQGLVTHWEITGDVDGVDFPHSDPGERGGPPESH